MVIPRTKIPTCVPKLLEVGWHDKRLKTLGCPGFALIKDPATFSTSKIGYMLAAQCEQVLNNNVGSAQVSFYDYFAIPHDGDAPQNQIGDTYNNAWILTGVNGTDFTDNGFPINVLADSDAHPYVVVDSGDEDIVLAGALYNIPFSAADQNTHTFSPVTICIIGGIDFHFTWSVGGELPSSNAVAQDGSGYFTRSRYPHGPLEISAEDQFPQSWNAIFPPPFWVDFLGNKAGPDPVYPLCMKVHSLNDAGGINVDMSLHLPQTELQMFENPSPISCTVDSMRANVQLTGGHKYDALPDVPGISGSFNPLNICEGDGFVASNHGNSENITWFYFLCNKCSYTPAWMGWLFGLQVRDMGEIYLTPPTIETTKIPA